jgi:hypothetical protein
VLQVLPFVAWLAPLVSAVLLIVSWADEESQGIGLVIASVLFAIAAYGQFLAGPGWVHTAGLPLQTLLAIYLLVRWRLEGAWTSRGRR